MSGAIGVEDLEQLLAKTGARGALCKPFELDALEAAIAEALAHTPTPPGPRAPSPA